MKNNLFYKAISILCLAMFVLTACAPKATPTAAPATSAPATSAPVTSAPATSAPAATSAPTTAAEAVTLTWMIDDSQQSQEGHKAIADAYMALHPNVTI